MSPRVVDELSEGWVGGAARVRSEQMAVLPQRPGASLTGEQIPAVLPFPRRTVLRQIEADGVAGDRSDVRPSRRSNESSHAHPALEIARENQAAARLTRDDARWVFAVVVRSMLEGGSQAILPPESRRRLLSQAHGAGIREFDAGLIIAIVQDGAKRGEWIAPARGASTERHEVSSELRERLAMVPRARQAHVDALGERFRARLVITCVLAVCIVLALMQWVSGGAQ
jgi:hypothetical protein